MPTNKGKPQYQNMLDYGRSSSEDQWIQQEDFLVDTFFMNLYKEAICLHS